MQSPSMIMSVPAVKGRWNPNLKFLLSLFKVFSQAVEILQLR